MKITSFNPLMLSVCAAILGAAQPASAAGVTTWSGGGGAGNQNWSTAGNWTTVGGSTPPASGDAVIFRALGGAGTPGTINNIVDSSRTIASLVFSNDIANLYHTTQIPSGNTLTVSGQIFLGSNILSGSYTITGGGTLRGGAGTSVYTLSPLNSSNMTNDMSGLSNFIWNAGGTGGNFFLGTDPGTTSGGILKLAAVSNNVTASSLFIANNNSGGNSTLFLGNGTNIINAGTVEIGGSKTTGTLTFNSTTGGVRWRAANGISGGTMELGGTPGHSGSSGSTFNGAANLKGHSVDMLFNWLAIANRGGRVLTGGSGSIGNFSFDAGVVTATNIYLGINSLGTNSAGTLSVGGGTLKVLNTLFAVNAGAPLTVAGSTPCLGNLIVTNGGSVMASSIVKSNANGTAVISITNATVFITSAAGSIGNSGAANRYAELQQRDGALET